MAFRLLLLSFVFSFYSLQASMGFVEPWGKDASLKVRKKQESTKDPIMTKVAEKVILFHQNVISPVDGPRSHFRPTSSRYMLLSIKKHGFLKGYLKGCDRLLRENSDDWVYRTIIVDGKAYKYDPVTK